MNEFMNVNRIKFLVKIHGEAARGCVINTVSARKRVYLNFRTVDYDEAAQFARNRLDGRCYGK